ncbi:hypothetical protein GYMLUDRAFT_179423, partial [Collybiopsis luxurians FD-317 M1]
FSEKVWAWWHTLQPPWQSITSNGRPAEVIAYGKSWETLNRPGRNRWLGLLTCLLWWKWDIGNLDQASRQELELEWLSAVKDMRKMFEGLLHHTQSIQCT